MVENEGYSTYDVSQSEEIQFSQHLDLICWPKAILLFVKDHYYTSKSHIRVLYLIKPMGFKIALK